MKWLRNILKGASLTGALFVFQACYGTPQSPFYERGEAPMTFSLVSDVTGEPIEGIQVTTDWKYVGDLGTSDADGRCRVNIPYEKNDKDSPKVIFNDPQGNYVQKDTILADLRDREIVIKMHRK
ncbi:MAG: hypothetical protein J6W74_02755 [Bacteroidales bacterium]|nr:hypothetical protein [Bacteroidales bacterium]